MFGVRWVPLILLRLLLCSSKNLSFLLASLQLVAGPSSNWTDSATSTLLTPPQPQTAVVLIELNTALLLMPTTLATGLMLSQDSVRVLTFSTDFTTTESTININFQLDTVKKTFLLESSKNLV